MKLDKKYEKIANLFKTNHNFLKTKIRFKYNVLTSNDVNDIEDFIQELSINKIFIEEKIKSLNSKAMTHFEFILRYQKLVDYTTKLERKNIAYGRKINYFFDFINTLF